MLMDWIKEEIEVSNKYLKKYSMSLAVRETQKCIDSPREVGWLDLNVSRKLVTSSAGQEVEV